MESENLINGVLAMISVMFAICSVYVVLKMNDRDYILKQTFKKYEIVTVNKDTIRGDFFLQKDSGFFSEYPGQYILLSDSTRYNEEKNCFN